MNLVRFILLLQSAFDNSFSLEHDSYTQENSNIIRLISNVRQEEQSFYKSTIIKRIEEAKTFTQKCALVRLYLKPQSTDFEYIIKRDIQLSQALSKIKGDASKKNISYEIKTSIHAKYSKLNIIQIRPYQHVDFYIICYYNMYFDNNLGKAFIFKIPSIEMNKLIVKYGSYAHGSKLILGPITIQSVVENKHEYALRCNPNKKTSKLWNELLKYETIYGEEKF